jgi:choline dehydrogenase-like flavoprotein
MSPMLADARPDEATAVVETPRLERKRVVIVGGGFAEIAAAKSLRGGDADVTLIDRRNHHIFQPLLYQVATALLAPSEAAAPIANCAPETFGYQLPYAPRDLYRNVIPEVSAGCSKTSVTCHRLGLSRI